LLIVPARHEGEATVPHPFYDELAAALDLRPADLAAITLHARDLLSPEWPSLGTLSAPSVDRLDPLALPVERVAWQVDPALLAAGTASARSLETLLGCPLKWALDHRVRLRGSNTAHSVPLHRLSGTLGHRLIEELFETPGEEERAPDVLDRLIATEAATLLQPGMSFEREQIRHDLLEAAAGLAQFLRDTGYRIVAVEQADTAPWMGGELRGTLDLILERERDELVLDLKWGRSRYRELLEKGLAVQLAVYAFIRSRQRGGRAPATGYFSLSYASLLTTHALSSARVVRVEGPNAEQVWQRVSATFEALSRVLERGRLPVTGVRRALPLLEVAGVTEPDQHLATPAGAACEYCDFGALCGRTFRELGDDPA
jgi:hypothetical protein